MALEKFTLIMQNTVHVHDLLGNEKPWSRAIWPAWTECSESAMTSPFPIEVTRPFIIKIFIHVHFRTLWTCMYTCTYMYMYLYNVHCRCTVKLSGKDSIGTYIRWTYSFEYFLEMNKVPRSNHWHFQISLWYMHVQCTCTCVHEQICIHARTWTSSGKMWARHVHVLYSACVCVYMCALGFVLHCIVISNVMQCIYMYTCTYICAIMNQWDSKCVQILVDNWPLP